MKYVVSDIHGDFEKYSKIFNVIGLKEYDILYVLGDVVDRGKDSVKILQDMMRKPYVKPLIGNHEYMAMTCLKMIEKGGADKDKLTAYLKAWLIDGGASTFNEYNDLTKKEQAEILDYLGEFELYEEVECGGKFFVLAHGGLNNFLEDMPLDEYGVFDFIFTRADYEKVYFKDKFLVTGHTPTRLIWGRDEVYKKNNHIAIDCGCAYGGKLAVYCLDNGREVYI